MSVQNILSNDAQYAKSQSLLKQAMTETQRTLTVISEMTNVLSPVATAHGSECSNADYAEHSQQEVPSRLAFVPPHVEHYLIATRANLHDILDKIVYLLSVHYSVLSSDDDVVDYLVTSISINADIIVIVHNLSRLSFSNCGD